MIRKFKSVISIFLLAAFLLPSFIQFDHKHELTRLCTDKSEKHIHVINEKCAICSFEFSLFTPGIENLSLLNNDPSDTYNNTYNSLFLSGLSRFSFLLRAPPLRLV